MCEVNRRGGLKPAEENLLWMTENWCNKIMDYFNGILP